MKSTDDGVRVIQTINLNDLPPGWTPSDADPLDVAQLAARRYLEYVASNPEALGDGDQWAAGRLRAELGNLRDSLDGGDLRHAARAGVAFGRALEELRVRLAASDRKAQNRSRKEGIAGGKKGGARRKENARKGAEEYCKYYDIEQKRDPGAKPHALCVRVAEKHGEAIKGRYGCGKSYKAVERAKFGDSKKPK